MVVHKLLLDSTVEPFLVGIHLRGLGIGGPVKPGVKVTPIVDWLVKTYGLGRPPAMAII